MGGFNVRMQQPGSVAELVEVRYPVQAIGSSNPGQVNEMIYKGDTGHLVVWYYVLIG